MKSLKLTGFAFILLCFTSCNTDDFKKHGEFEFVSEYSTIVTVGGVVGIMDRTFEIGEVYRGTDDGGKTITIIIAEHSERNDDCPNSWCYQEFLEVPREYLKIVK